MSDIKVDGMMKIPNNVEGENINVNGMLKVDGNVIAKCLDGDGITKIKGSATISFIDMDGVLKVGNKIKTDKLTMDGLVKAESIEGEEIYIDGNLNITQSINCEILDIKFDTKSRIDSIECTTVNIVYKKRQKCYLTINNISADEIIIQNVKCNTIYGDKIVIGPNCEITNVEYKTSLEVHESSNIKQIQKIEVK